jgi:histidinol dehydrogenase
MGDGMSFRPRLHDLAALNNAERTALMRRAEADLGPFMERVRQIVEAVRTDGDAALVRLAREIDNVALDPALIAATDSEFEAADADLSAEVKDAIAYAARSIRRYHEDQKPPEMWLHEIHPGAYAGERTLPIPSAACYVPRGKGSFPSVAMMTTIPAVVAGVAEVCIVTPPGPGGQVDAGTLVAARLAGVSRVYKCGGAAALAAVAYGTQTVPRCAKIVGPGSPWMAAAKRLLADVIDTGTPAGPSESIILADASADGRLAALDLLIEAEHGPDSSAYLVTPSRAVAEAAAEALPGYLAHMGEQRASFAKTVLGGPRGGIVLAPSLDGAIDFVNDYAPEHLEILAAEPMALLGRIRNAGEVLLGRHTPIVIGNFVLGANAVLPTNAAARTHSPLSVFDFMKRMSVGYVTAPAYPELGRHAHALATYEGFEAHANAVSALRDPWVKP